MFPSYSRILLFIIVTAFAILGVAGTAAAQETPASQLVALARHVDAAIGALDRGNRAAAQSGYSSFENGWFVIEDGIRDQSRTSYRDIEGAMADTRYRLQAEPFDSTLARTALMALRQHCEAFISGRTTIKPAPSPASNAKVTMASLVGRIETAIQLIDTSDATSAAEEVDTIREEWIEVEGLVKAKSAGVYTDTENNMANAYALLTQSTPDMPGARRVLAEMKQELTPFATGEVSYGVLDAAIILLREGLEALLVIGALLAFLTKAGYSAQRRWIWIGGLAGILVSLVVAFAINLFFARASGENRELLEGVTGLAAAGMLIYMSYWLHSKASLGAWQKYIREKSSSALANNSIFSLSLIAFLAVFREGAETVLFYIGIAPSISTGDLITGAGVGVGGLAVLGVLMLVFGLRIPIKPFFLATTVLILYLALKFIGTGVHALQVGGYLRSTPADYLPSNGFVGVFPTWETTAPQLALVVAAIIVALLPRFRKPVADSPTSLPSQERD